MMYWDKSVLQQYRLIFCELDKDEQVLLDKNSQIQVKSWLEKLFCLWLSERGILPVLIEDLKDKIHSWFCSSQTVSEDSVSS